MSTIDTSTWNPDPALNESIGDIPLNETASIRQTWQAIQMLMAAGGLHGLQLVTFEGATASADGKQGLVPAPEAGDQDKVLKGDGAWGTLSVSDIPNIDASKITSGTIDLARLPAGALERLVTVADQTARFALTATDVQLGDTVKQLDTGVMYIVVDTSKLGQADGYVEFTAGSATSVPWSGVTDKPSTFTPSSHTHGSITNDGKLGTASRVVVTDGDKKIDVSSVTSTELGYLSGVTSAVQTQINSKVSKSGDTMTGDLTISSNSPNLFLQNTLIERGTAPSSNKATTEILGKDKNDKNAWALYHTYDTDKTHRIRLLCYNGLTTDSQYAEIGVGYDSDGNPYTNAPTPAAGDNSTKIATTAFVKTKCDGYLPLSGGTLTGTLNERASNVNLAVEPSSSKEDYRFYITRNTADTVHTGNLMRLGVSQSAGTKDYRILLAVANPRAGNLPTQESIAGGVDDSDARTSNCWGGIGVAYDYSKNRAYPYCYDLDTCDPTDNSTQRLATNYWVRNATGNFACNAATATKATQDGSGNTITDYYCTLSTSQTVAGNKTFSGKVAVQNGITGINKDNVVKSANDLWLSSAGDVGKKQAYFTTTTNNTKLTNIPSTVATTIESYTVRRLSATDWVVNQILHNTSSNLYFRHGTSTNGGTWSSWKTFAFTDSDITGNAATATKLATPRTINGVSFDGSTDITVADSTKVSKSGDETISGKKTFTTSIVVERENAGLQLNNSSGSARSDIQFMVEDAPLAVIRLDPNGSFQIGRASDPAGNWYDGALLALYDTGNASLRVSDNAGTNQHTLALGIYGSLLWDGQPLQTSSDERLKTPVAPVPDAVLDAWEGVNWGQFRYLDAVERKGEDARLHLGLIAQRVKAVFDARGLDACQYGVLCHEEREATDETPAVDLWTVRYEEALALEAACQRRRADRLEARIAALEEAMNG